MPSAQTSDVWPKAWPALTALVVMALLPRIAVDRFRVSLDQHHTAGVFVAPLGVLPVLYGAGFWVSMTVLMVVAIGSLGLVASPRIRATSLTRGVAEAVSVIWAAMENCEPVENRQACRELSKLRGEPQQAWLRWVL